MNGLLLQCYYFLIIFCFLWQCVKKRLIVVRRFSKGKLSEVKFVLGFPLTLPFPSVSSLTTASIDMNLWKTHCLGILLLSFHAGRRSNLLFQELRKYRRSLSMTQICGKEYAVNQEIFSVSNLLFNNQSICFLSQVEYLA